MKPRLRYRTPWYSSGPGWVCELPTDSLRSRGYGHTPLSAYMDWLHQWVGAGRFG